MTDKTPKGLAEVMREAVANSIWATRPVEEEPEVLLSRWAIMEVAGERHFVGYCEANWEGRVSSTIVTFDEESKKGITKSGRVYQLLGETGMDRDADYVLGIWLRVNGFKNEDVRWVVAPQWLIENDGV